MLYDKKNFKIGLNSKICCLLKKKLKREIFMEYLVFKRNG